MSKAAFLLNSLNTSCYNFAKCLNRFPETASQKSKHKLKGIKTAPLKTNIFRKMKAGTQNRALSSVYLHHNNPAQLLSACVLQSIK